VAGGAPPEELFAAVTEEAGRLLQTDQTMMIRYEADGTVTLVAAWSERGDTIPLSAWKRLGAGNHITLLWQAAHQSRAGSYADAFGAAGMAARQAGRA
jgi:GAF domain-containing protein